MIPCDSIDSSFGNSSLTSFLSTLLREENVTSVIIEDDNAKAGLDSLLSLRLVEDEPKCRWNSLVREVSESDLRKRNRQKSSITLKSNSELDKSVPRRKCGSDPNLMLMPIRKKSPNKLSRPKISLSTMPTSAATVSDPDLLRMPKRLPSPGEGQSQRGTINASWDTSSLATEKRKNYTNLFLDILMEPIDTVEDGHSLIRDA